MKIGAVIFSPGCNLKCRFCRPSKPDSVSREQIELNLIKIYENIDYHIDHGVDSFEISGCDPCDGEFDDLISIVKKIKSKNIESIMLATNGYSLNSTDKVKALIDAGITCIRIPIYGTTPEIHNQIVGGDGFNNSIEALTLFIKSGCKITFQTLITSINKNNIIELMAYIIDLIDANSPYGLNALNFIGISIPAISDPIDDIKIKELSHYYIPNKELSLVVKQVHDFIEQLGSNIIQFLEIPYCLVGKDSLYITNKNDIIKTLIGNQKPDKMLASPENDAIPNYRVHENLDFCLDCIVKYKCQGFSRNDIRTYGIEKKDIVVIK